VEAVSGKDLIMMAVAQQMLLKTWKYAGMERMMTVMACPIALILDVIQIHFAGLLAETVLIGMITQHAWQMNVNG